MAETTLTVEVSVRGAVGTRVGPCPARCIRGGRVRQCEERYADHAPYRHSTNIYDIDPGSHFWWEDDDWCALPSGDEIAGLILAIGAT